jgi:hypothetical protein
LKKSLGDLATTKPVQLVGKMTTSEITKATDAAARLKIALE